MKQGHALLALQQVDTELARKKFELENIPEGEAIKTARAQQKDLQKKLSRLIAERKDIQMDIEDLDAEETTIVAQVDDLQNRSNTSSDFRNAQDLERAHSQALKALDKLTFKRNGLQEKLDTYLDYEQQATQALEKLKDRENRLIANYRTKGLKVKSEIEELVEERSEYVSHLTNELYANYEVTRTRFAGVGVGELIDGMCTACRKQFPEGQEIRLRQDAPITECPSCRRILIITDDLDNE